MKKYAVELKWGILFSLFSIVWMILEKTVGLHDRYIDKQAIYTNLFAIVAFIIYFLALIDKKKRFYNGKMTWKQGFISGIALSFVISLLKALFCELKGFFLLLLTTLVILVIFGKLVFLLYILLRHFFLLSNILLLFLISISEGSGDFFLLKKYVYPNT